MFARFTNYIRWVMNKVGGLKIEGAPDDAVYTLADNPGGYFSIRGSEILAAPHTPAGVYTLPITATAKGFLINQTFVLRHEGVAAA
jgi:hypothetical protein